MPLTTQRPTEKLKKSLFKEDIPKARLNCELEKSLYKRIQRRCIDEDKSVTDMTKQLWLDYLDKVDPE